MLDKIKLALYNPMFDSVLVKKVPQPAYLAAFGTFG